jgi:predicted permease
MMMKHLDGSLAGTIERNFHMNVVLQIFLQNILPIFILVTLGYLVSRKFSIDIGSLNKIIFWLLVPAFMFANLYVTDIGVDALKALSIAVLILLSNMAIGVVISKVRKYENGMENAFQNSVMFYNSGNIGIPLITLVFSTGSFLVDGKTPYLGIALTTQIMVLVVQSVSVNTLGFFNAGRANLHWKIAVTNVLKMPAIYVVALAFLLKLVPFDFTTLPVWPAILYLKGALVPMALTALGAQLAKVKFQFDNRTAWLAVFIRLIIGPALALLFVMLFGLHGILAQALFISSAVPTAVNSALVAVECDNHPGFATQVVILSTLFSGVTLIGVIYGASLLFPV